MEHVACIGDMRSTYIILVRKYKGKRPFGNLGLVESVLFRWVLRK